MELLLDFLYFALNFFIIVFFLTNIYVLIRVLKIINFFAYKEVSDSEKNPD